MVGIGVQVMSGFLLSIPVANRFVKLDHTERGIYLVTIVLAALSTAPLAAPVAYHRTLSRRHQKGSLVPGDQPAGHRGLVTVGRAICSAVLLVTSFARRRKVDGRSSMNKAQLQQALGR